MKTTVKVAMAVGVGSLAIGGVGLGTIVPAVAADDGTDISVFAITDLHGHLEQQTGKDGTLTELGAATLSCAVKQLRANVTNSTFVSVGDNIGGSAWVSAASGDEPTIAALNAMGLEVSALGNHEFDDGWRDLQARIAGGPAVGLDGTTLTGASAMTHVKPDFPYLVNNASTGGFEPYVIKSIAGVKVAFIGTLTKDMDSLVSRSALEGIQFTAPGPVTNDMARELKETGRADVAIVLAHEDAETIVGTLDGSVIDGLLAGHSHIDYVNEHAPALNGTTIPTLEAASFGKVLGQLDIHVPDGGKPRVTVKNLGPDAIPAHCISQPDPQVDKIVKDARAAADELGKKVVGRVGGTFMRGQSLAEGVFRSDRAATSTLSNMVADAARAYGESLPRPDGMPLVGLTNAGGVRADLKPAADGSVTYEQLITVQPFGNQIGYQDVSVADLRRVLNEQVQPAVTGRAFLRLGTSENLSYVFDPTVSEPGADNGYVTDLRIDGRKLADTDTVRVYGNQFLLEGGDNYTTFHKANFHVLGATDLDVLMSYVKANEPAPDYRPRTIGARIDGALEPGHSVNVQLSHLSYLGKEAPATYEVEALIGDIVVGKATVANPTSGGPDTTATTSMTIEVPRNISADHELSIRVVPAGSALASHAFALPLGHAGLSLPKPVELGRADRVGPGVSHAAAGSRHLARTGTDALVALAFAGVLTVTGGMCLGARRIRSR